jgi:hypothetical protein
MNVFFGLVWIYPKKMLLFESKMEALRDKLKQHNNELALRETPVIAPA